MITTKVRTKLWLIELFLYLIVWISCIAYAIYHVYLTSRDYFGENFDDRYNDFSEGWCWLGRKKDNSDNEWKMGIEVLKYLVPWYILHHVVNENLEKKHHMEIWHALLGSAFITYYLDYQTLIFISIQPFLFATVAQFRKKPLIWLTSITLLLVVNCFNYVDIDWLQENEEKQHVIMVTIAWINLRCLNYYLDAVQEVKTSRLTLTNLLSITGYCLYLPLLFHGPIILYSNYQKSFGGKQRLSERFQVLCGRLCRFCCWLLFTEFALHFVYANALTYQVQIIAKMNTWSLYGLGYCMGQFFHLKYLVFYGISTTFAQFDNIPVPDTPKCIGRIHLYSDMWRFFDVGLYIFLTRYIYVPFIGNNKSNVHKLVGSFICFTFVFIWHGAYEYVAIWSLLNFLGVTLENLTANVWKLVAVQKLSQSDMRRLTCVLASPLFAMSALSNFYFFAGKDVGDLYMRRFLNDSLMVSLSIVLLLYCGSQISVEISEREKTSKVKVN